MPISCVVPPNRLGLIFLCESHTLFSDAGLLAGEVAQIVELSATNLTNLVDSDAVDAGTFEGENTLHTYCAGHLAHGEALLDAMTSDFDDNAAILLYALLVAFDNFVSYGDGVTSLEGRMNLACSKCFFSNFN